MSDLILPPSCKPNRTPVQLTGKEKVCVLIHAETNRILCFAYDDRFTNRFASLGYKKVEINHASEYDAWARRLREQARIEDQVADHAYLERENAVRMRLRQQLIDRRASTNSTVERKTIDSALHALEFMEKRRQRYRSESFMLQEAYEDSNKNIGEDALNQLMAPPKK